MFVKLHDNGRCRFICLSCFFACAPQGKIPELAKCAIFFKTEKLQQIWHEHRSRVVLCALKHQTGQAPPWWTPQFVSGGRRLRIKNRFCHWTRPSLRAELAMSMSLQQMDLGLTVSKQQCETCDLHCSRFWCRWSILQVVILKAHLVKGVHAWLSWGPIGEAGEGCVWFQDLDQTAFSVTNILEWTYLERGTRVRVTRKHIVYSDKTYGNKWKHSKSKNFILAQQKHKRIFPISCGCTLRGRLCSRFGSTKSKVDSIP